MAHKRPKRAPVALNSGLPGTVTAVALIVPPTLSESKTVAALGLVRDVAGATPWWAADLLIHAEDHWGEKIGQISEALGWAPSTLSNLIWIGRRFPPSRRRELPMTLAHHVEVATLEPEDAAHWLDRATKGDGPGAPWSTRRLRKEIKAVCGPGPEEHEETPCSRCGGTGVEP